MVTADKEEEDDDDFQEPPPRNGEAGINGGHAPAPDAEPTDDEIYEINLAVSYFLRFLFYFLAFLLSVSVISRV